MVLAFYKLLFMNKLKFSSSENMGGGMVFYQVFPLSKSQIQAVEISSRRKPKVGSKIPSRDDCE